MDNEKPPSTFKEWCKRSSVSHNNWRRMRKAGERDREKKGGGNNSKNGNNSSVLRTFNFYLYFHFTLTNWTILWSYLIDLLISWSLDLILRLYLIKLSLDLISRLSYPWSYLRYVLSLSSWSDDMRKTRTFHLWLITYLCLTYAFHCFIGMRWPPAFHLWSTCIMLLRNIPLPYALHVSASRLPHAS